MTHSKSKQVVRPVWQLDESFPEASGGWSAWRPPFGQVKNTKEAVHAGVRRWHLRDPLLVATPTSTRQLPPVCVPELSAEIQARILRQYRSFIFFAAIVSIVSAVFWARTGGRVFLGYSVLVVVICLVTAIQYQLLLKDVQKLRAASRFFTWAFMRGWIYAVVSAILMVALGALQYVLQNRAGGFEPLLLSWGLVFDLAVQQSWRYFLGPFFHSDFVHWFTNTLILAFVVGLSAVVIRHLIWGLVLVVGIVGAPLILSFSPYVIGLDAFVGISGGIFSLLGLLSCIGLMKKDLFPPLFTFNVISFSLIMVAGSHLINERSSDFVHLMGWGLVFKGFISSKLRVE